MKKISPGDITDRIKLRKNLKCKSFQWYLDNVFPESGFRKEHFHRGAVSVQSCFFKNRNAYKDCFKVQNVADKRCIDIINGLVMFNCHGLGGNQFFAFSKEGQIISVEEKCLGVSHGRSTVTLFRCTEPDSTQFWKYDDKVSMIFKFTV